MVSAETLRQFPFFQWATQDSLETLSMVSEERSIRAGELIFSRGEPAEFLYILVRGEVTIEYDTGNGERRPVDHLGPGDLMVWSAVVEPHRNTSYGVATKDCEVVAIDAARLRQLMREDGEFQQSLMSQLVQVVASRLTGARRQLAQLG